MKKYCVYLRVSTQKQGAGGLGIEAQRKMCEDFIAYNQGEKVCEFMDVESGTHRNRKGLWQAIDYCKRNGTELVIAKLDRLARDVEFTFKVINTGIGIHFTDMPVINSMILGVFASVAQYERELISYRTTQALAAKKARGEKTGGAADKWMEAFKSKSKEELEEEYKVRGNRKRTRFLESRDVQAFLKVLRNVFPDACKGDEPESWAWSEINTKNDNKERIVRVMRDYKELDEGGVLFAKWDLSLSPVALQQKIAAYLQTLRRAYLLEK